MFPDHDDTFIEEVINNYDLDYNNNSETDLDNLIDYFLDLSFLKNSDVNSSFYPPNNEDNLTDFVFEDFDEQFIPPDKMTVKNQHEILIKAFPNADPEFLLDIVEQYHEDPDSMYQVVENKLLSGNYKTRSEYYAKLKSTEKPIDKNEFKIEEFVIRYSNPFDFFENLERKCEYSVNGLNFLKQRYACYKLCALFSIKVLLSIFIFLTLTFLG